MAVKNVKKALAKLQKNRHEKLATLDCLCYTNIEFNRVCARSLI
jgi:hypothetical protein